ncbi:MAG: peptidylprolyl isomerase [Chromatiaceae bacterium]|nr:peptidylprolyl isomerase [Chromatiaceae bacterium]MCP5421968.1 peptidylprolyl isomerase [Chromatiaceae bacterium]
MKRIVPARVLATALAVALLHLSTAALSGQSATESQVLVTVGSRAISADQLEGALRSSPIATQFNTFDEDVQAGIRGQMLKDLIYSEMLYQEGLSHKVDQRPEVLDQVESYRRGELFRQYLSALRQEVATGIQGSVDPSERNRGDGDAVAAARAASLAEKFAEVKKQRLLELGTQDHLTVFRDALAPGQRRADSLIARGDTLVIHLSDLLYRGEEPEGVDGVELLRRLDGAVEHGLFVQAAERARLNIADHVDGFRRDLVRQVVMQEKEKAWVPDRATLVDYYNSHPALSRVPEEWHVVQVVSADRASAEQVRGKIVDGESIYRIASEQSTDPYGRQHGGDMGWVRSDQAPPALRSALEHLPDGQISPVIETALGFHVVMLEGRRGGEQRPLNVVAGGIRRSLILERLAQDYAALSQRYPINWNLPEHKTTISAKID